ncbi:MAG: hypothetical protein C4527_28025 [Candidatus Omnitrophota bacterium]|jgi:DNA-binding NtrC family response regulator|nr:MAG: hypothetical protein C4527_28025 [Candidatus Omnitrophota bacterium]
MIAPRESVLHILSIGLQPQEREMLQNFAKESGDDLIFAKNDLDLWNHARNGNFDLCVLAQTEEIPDPSYLIWLLKGLANHSKVVLIFTTLTPELEERLQRFHASRALERPIDSQQLTRAIKNVLNTREEKSDWFWSSISRLFHSRRRAKVH